MRAQADPSRSFGKYVLVRPLGQGGMGEVWLAWDGSLARQVALKFLSGQAALDKARFLREAQLSAQLKHPHIVAVHETGEVDGRAYIAMEYVQGRTLDACQLPVEKALSVMAEVGEAVHHAHERGIIHRDLKPQNLMMDAGGRVFVMDFGLALQVEAPSGVSLSGSILGTPVYMSPEQARGERKLDARSDVYSLGATLYALLTRQPPVLGDAVLEVIQNVAEGRLVPPRAYNPGIPAEVETLVLKAMALEPDRRYATARAFAEDLKRYLDGEPILARPAGTIYVLRKKLAKHRWVALACAAALVLAVSFGGWVLSGRLRRAELRSEAGRLEREGRLQDALQRYEGALALSGQDPELEASTERVRALVREERARSEEARRKAEAERMQAVALQKAMESYAQLGQVFAQLRLKTYRKDFRLTEEDFREFGRVRDACRKVMEASRDCGEGWWVIAQATQLLGDVRGAIDAYDRGLAADPGHGMCLLDKARLLIERAQSNRGRPGDLEQALAHLEQGVTAGGVSGIELDLARGYAKALKSPAEAGPYCEGMLGKWRGKDFAEEFHLVRGLAEPKSLIQEATKALDARPAFYQALYWRAFARTRSSELQEAVRDLDRALEIHPRSYPARFHRALVHQRLGDMKRAVADYDQVVLLDPGVASAYSNRAEARRLQGDLKGAVSDCDEALRLDPGLPEAFCNRGIARLVQGDFQGAAGDFDEALRLNPRMIMAYCNRGVVRSSLGDLKGAVADYDEALRLNPGLAEAVYNRGNAKLALGDLKGAVEDYDGALRLDPHMSRACCNRGNAKRALGDLKGAIADFDAALRLDPKLPEAHLNRGIAKLALAAASPGPASALLDSAVEDLEAALRLAPESGPVRRECEARLQALRRSPAGRIP